ncbi:hypothetical protein [Nocardia rhamnosiphila]|uniref:hypothetical protein n=1 Tax=Nocardia rhamnosiphila TaxID=426716 RepID=UPI0004C45B6E|nr:hypothetical protein [Nocardia rhamnosiphila]
MCGEIVTYGYRGMPERTAEALDAQGWLRIGDIGTPGRAARSAHRIAPRRASPARRGYDLRRSLRAHPR